MSNEDCLEFEGRIDMSETIKKERKFYQFFQEDNGNLSSTRLLFVLWSVAVLIVWIFSSITSSPAKLASIPLEVIGIIATFAGAKVGQKFSEEKDKKS